MGEGILDRKSIIIDTKFNVKMQTMDIVSNPNDIHDAAHRYQFYINGGKGFAASNNLGIEVTAYQRHNHRHLKILKALNFGDRPRNTVNIPCRQPIQPARNHTGTIAIDKLDALEKKGNQGLAWIKEDTLLK